MEEKYDIKQTEFTWDCPLEGYYWEDCAKLTPARFPSGQPQQPNRKPPFLVKNPNAKQVWRVKTLVVKPKLFLEFSELPVNKRKILAFANKHGSLTGYKGSCEVEIYSPRYRFRKGERNPFPDIGRGIYRNRGYDYPIIPSESLYIWRSEITEMRRLVNVWERIVNGDNTYLQKVICWKGDRVDCFLADIDEQGKILGKYKTAKEAIEKDDMLTPGILWAEIARADDSNKSIYRTFKKSDCIKPAKRLVQQRINKNLEKHGVKIKLLYSLDDASLVLRLVPATLIAALWVEFALWVNGENRFNRCEVCGKWIDVTNTRSDKKYHDDCNGSTLRSRDFRNIKNEIINFYVISSGESKQEAEKWLSNYKEKTDKTLKEILEGLKNENIIINTKKKNQGGTKSKKS